MNRRARQLNEDILERRRQEDESVRLRVAVPNLLKLRLELSESRGNGQVEIAYIRRVTLESAPSVFLMACGDPRCKHGWYDLTPQILSWLRRGERRIEATGTCGGDVGTARCNRVLQCVAVAEYTS
jgi:hypothetical protein